ncbi:MAG TPA: ATP-binding protein, partial [Candidatus Obscuribacterales bacterium]
IKYTPTGGRIAVQVRHDPAAAEVGVPVSDTGIGIPEECLAQIFDRFYRVERKVHTIKGTGLGLTIVKKIVEEHNGRVGVKSALGEGSTFSIYLPAEPQPEGPAQAPGTSGAVQAGDQEAGRLSVGA